LIPLISANTQARHEGYFRLEWELAAECAMSVASGVALILPIIIDATRSCRIVFGKSSGRACPAAKSRPRCARAC
jgi:hypothetical protein